MSRRQLASIGSIGLGAVLLIASIGTWAMVSSTLSAQQITTPDNAVCLPERQVRGPFSAYCQAQTIDDHVRDITGGLTYAELPRDDDRRPTAQDAAFLQASLFTSVVAFGVAAMAAGMGLIFILLGLGMRDVDRQLADERQPIKRG